MRTSTDCIVKMMFTNQLSKTGNLTMAYDEQQVSRTKPSGKSKWGAALIAEKTNTKVKTEINNNFHSNHIIIIIVHTHSAILLFFFMCKTHVHYPYIPQHIITLYHNYSPRNIT